MTDLVRLHDWSEIDRLLHLPDDDEIPRLAEAWDAAKEAAWGRPEIRKGGRAIGLYGERAFARLFRVPMDTEFRKYGSRRVNAHLLDGTRVDVVTRERRKGVTELAIPVSAKRRPGMVWVLVVWNGLAHEPDFPGWITEDDALRVGEVRAPFNRERGRKNIVVPSGCLRPIGELLERHELTEWRSLYPWLIPVRSVVPAPAEEPREEVAQLSLL